MCQAQMSLGVIFLDLWWLIPETFCEHCPKVLDHPWTNRYRSIAFILSDSWSWQKNVLICLWRELCLDKYLNLSREQIFMDIIVNNRCNRFPTGVGYPCCRHCVQVTVRPNCSPHHPYCYSARHWVTPSLLSSSRVQNVWWLSVYNSSSRQGASEDSIDCEPLSYHCVPVSMLPGIMGRQIYGQHWALAGGMRHRETERDRGDLG